MTGAAPQTGYRIVLPPAWVRIPLREDPGKAVDAILEPKFADLPKDSYGPIQAELRKRLMAQIDTAREHEGLDLYLPIEQVHGKTLAASFVVSLLEFDSVEKPPPEDVLVSFASRADGDASFVEIDDAGAVRMERTVSAVTGAEDDTQFGSRRVDYVIAIPKMADAFLSVSFSTLGDGNPDSDVSKLLVELFDAVMSTFRWVFAKR